MLTIPTFPERSTLSTLIALLLFMAGNGVVDSEVGRLGVQSMAVPSTARQLPPMYGTLNV